MSEKISGMGGVILVETESGKTLNHVKNTVTTLLEEYVAALSLGSMFSGCSAIEAGQNFVFSHIGFVGGMHDYYNNKDSLITVYLLNLSAEEKAALSKSSNLLPVYGSTFELDSSKVVGYATVTYTATEPKQGYVIPTTGTTLANPRRQGLKFQWDTGVLSGTYNAIAIGFNTTKNPYSGVAVYRGLESNNQILGENDPDAYLIKPGIKSADGSIVITGENEILLGDSTATQKGRKILNLVSGEVTLLSADDIRYDFPLIPAAYPQLCSGNYLIYSNNSSLYKVDLSTRTQTSVATGYDCFIYNGYLYSRYNTTTYRAYTLDTITYTSSKNLTIANMGFPSEFLTTANSFVYGISSVGENYLVVYRFTSYGTSYTYAQSNMKALICSNPTDIEGSIVEVLPCINTFNGCVVAGKKVFFDGVFPHSDSNANQEQFLDSAGTSYKQIYKNGLKMTTEGLYGNLLSFKTFDTDQEIPTGEGLKLTYYYTFEQ